MAFGQNSKELLEILSSSKEGINKYNFESNYGRNVRVISSLEWDRI